MKVNYKVLLLLLVMSLLSSRFKAQENLVPNPSFEEFGLCPMGNGNITDCSNWINFGNTPDYYNACSIAEGMGVPYTIGGFQFPHTGNGMVGVITWVNPSNTPENINYREYIGVQFDNPLIIGEKYFFSFHTNYSGYPPTNLNSDPPVSYKKVASNKIGLRFSTNSYSSTALPLINNFANLYSDSILNDTVLWIKLSGSFIADSSYNFIAIGNFFDDNHTDTSSYEGPSFGSMSGYYFLDDICVSTDSLLNETWTVIRSEKKSKYKLQIYPNPASGYVTIASAENIKSLELINSNGQIVNTLDLNNDLSFDLDLKKYSSGIYIIRVQTLNNTFTQILNINN